MVCSMVKKGIVGAALGAGALFLVFGTHAPSYLKTAYKSVRRDVKNAVPLPFDIERARDQIASLEPAIRDNIEKLARAEVEVEHLDKEIMAYRTNMDAEKSALLTLRKSLETGEYRLAGHSSVAYTEDEVKADLGHRLDSYNNFKVILAAKESTLKARQSEIVAFRKQLETMMAKKKELSSKLDGIEAKLSQIQATQASNEFQLDGSALSRAKETVSDLEQRLEIMQKAAQLEARYVETGVPVILKSNRDVVKEIDAEFSQPTAEKGSKTGGKSL